MPCTNRSYRQGQPPIDGAVTMKLLCIALSPQINSAASKLFLDAVAASTGGSPPSRMQPVLASNPGMRHIPPVSLEPHLLT